MKILFFFFFWLSSGFSINQNTINLEIFTNHLGIYSSERKFNKYKYSGERESPEVTIEIWLDTSLRIFFLRFKWRFLRTTWDAPEQPVELTQKLVIETIAYSHVATIASHCYSIIIEVFYWCRTLLLKVS